VLLLTTWEISSVWYYLSGFYFYFFRRAAIRHWACASRLERQDSHGFFRMALLIIPLLYLPLQEFLPFLESFLSHRWRLGLGFGYSASTASSLPLLFIVLRKGGGEFFLPRSVVQCSHLGVCKSGAIL